MLSPRQYAILMSEKKKHREMQGTNPMHSLTPNPISSDRINSLTSNLTPSMPKIKGFPRLFNLLKKPKIY